MFYPWTLEVTVGLVKIRPCVSIIPHHIDFESGICDNFNRHVSFSGLRNKQNNLTRIRIQVSRNSWNLWHPSQLMKISPQNYNCHCETIWILKLLLACLKYYFQGSGYHSLQHHRYSYLPPGPGKNLFW